MNVETFHRLIVDLMNDNNDNMDKEITIFNADTREWEPILGVLLKNEEAMVFSKNTECDHGYRMLEHCIECKRIVSISDSRETLQ